MSSKEISCPTPLAASNHAENFRSTLSWWKIWWTTRRRLAAYTGPAAFFWFVVILAEGIERCVMISAPALRVYKILFVLVEAQGNKYFPEPVLTVQSQCLLEEHAEEWRSPNSLLLLFFFIICTPWQPDNWQKGHKAAAVSGKEKAVMYKCYCICPDEILYFPSFALLIVRNLNDIKSIILKRKTKFV